MARIRSIKPEFWTDGVMVTLTPLARLLYIGMWNFACDGGHLENDPVSLKLRILPMDDVDARGLVAELLDTGRIRRRVMGDGREYLAILRFGDHQKVDARWNSRCPYCVAENSHGPTDAPPTSPKPPRDSPKLPDSRHGVEWSGVDTQKKTPSSSAARGARKTAGTRIPDDFHATPDMIEWAREHTPLVGAAETDAFVDYWRSAPGAKGVKVDWVATWRNWMRRDQGRREQDQPRASPGNSVVPFQPRRMSTADQRFADAMALAEQYREQDES